MFYQGKNPEEASYIEDSSAEIVNEVQDNEVDL